MPSILIVEDHKSLGQILTRILHADGNFEIPCVVETAEAALEQLSELNIDLALVDVSLPGTTGIELVSMIHERYPSLPCIMLSGYTATHYVNHALAAGARGYVVKDDISELIGGIRCVLEGGTYLSKQLGEEKPKLIQT